MIFFPYTFLSASKSLLVSFFLISSPLYFPQRREGIQRQNTPSYHMTQEVSPLLKVFSATTLRTALLPPSKSLRATPCVKIQSFMFQLHARNISWCWDARPSGAEGGKTQSSVGWSSQRTSERLLERTGFIFLHSQTQVITQRSGDEGEPTGLENTCVASSGECSLLPQEYFR